MKSRSALVLVPALVGSFAACGLIAPSSDFESPDAATTTVAHPAEAGAPDAAHAQDSGRRDAGPSDAGPPDAGPSSIEWTPCTDPFTGDCALVPLPVDRKAPNGKTLDVFVTRFSNPPNPRGSLWFLQGGPGGSISAFEQALSAYRELYPDLTLYGMEHRGVARSSRLDCENDLCAQFADLPFYSTTAAAADLHALIGLTRVPGSPTFVYGVSYGTYVAQRYLTMFPTEPSAVVLDSVVPLQGLTFSDGDREGDYPFAYLAQDCQEDAFCSSKIPAPTLPTLRATLGTISAGHCPSSTLDHAAAAMLRSALQFNELNWTLVPVLYRYQRCTPDDARVIANYLQQLQQLLLTQKAAPFDPADQDENIATYLNVAFSELWELPPPSQNVLQARYDAALLPAGGITDLGATRASWPVYPQDEFHDHYADTTVPVLTLNGTLDSQTPLDLVKQVGEHYTKPHQQFVVIPNANHGTAISFFDAPIPCGSRIMQGFLQDPTATLDTTCTQTPEVIRFDGDPESNQFFFGTADAWEGTLGGPQPMRVLSPRLRTKLAQIQARWRLNGH